MKEDFQDFVQKLQQEFELKEPLTGEEEGSFAFLLDDVKIEIRPVSLGFELFASIAPLPKEKTEEFLTQMLRGNLFGQATRHAYLGLDETGNTVITRLSRNKKTTYKEFHEEVEDFLNVVDFWKAEITSADL